MKIYGLQKMTLLDYPGRVACTVFTGGCNFRCPFCHNAPLVTHIDAGSSMDDTELLAFLKTRKGLLDGVCVTGGEPLMHPGIGEMLRRIRELGFAVKLDTNGSFPDRLRALVEDGLVDRVAMDVKNCPEKYALTVGIPDFDLAPVSESIRYLLEGHVEYEFRTTVVAELHTVADIESLTQHIVGCPEYYLQNFTDSGDLIGTDLHACSKEVMVEMREKAAKYVKNATIRGL